MARTRRQRLPKDVCRYAIHLLEPTAERAAEVLEACRRIANPWLEDYIWQSESFTLHIDSAERAAPHTFSALAESVDPPGTTLSGSLHFGDCVEDEWFTVWILHTLSMQCPDVLVRLHDTDGEFLLIEAARRLPRWLEPSAERNRVWLRDGKLAIIPAAEHEIKARSVGGLDLDVALEYLRLGGVVLQNDAMQKDAFARIQNYPQRAQKEMHWTRCKLPRALAALLHAEPALIAPICTAFTTRTKAQEAAANCGRVHYDAGDVVEVSVKFTRTLYAAVKATRLSRAPATGERTAESGNGDSSGGAAGIDKARELGQKVEAGAALLAQDDATFSKRLQAVASSTLPSDADLANWCQQVDSDAYLDVDYAELERALNGDGDGSESDDDEDRADGALGGGPEARGKKRKDKFDDTTIQNMVDQMKKFMSGEAGLEGIELDDDDDDVEDDDDGNNDDDHDDDDEDGDDCDGVLGEDNDHEGSGPGNVDASAFEGDRAKDTDRPRVKTAAADVRSDNEQPVVDADPDIAKLEAEEKRGKDATSFLQFLQHSLKGKAIDRGAAAAGTDADVGEDGDDAALRAWLSQADASDAEEAAGDDTDSEVDLQEYMADMDAELYGTKARTDTANPAEEGVLPAQSSSGTGVKPGAGAARSSKESELDYMLARGLLQSLKAQGGAAGPAGQMLASLGISVPRDDDDDAGDGDVDMDT